MRAHQIENGKVINTIEVESLDFMPNLIDASSGTIGDLWDGVNFTTPIKPRDIQAEIAVLEASITNRRIREAIRGQGKAWLDNIDDQIAALRAQLPV